MRTGKMAGVCISTGLVLLFAAWLGGAQQKPAQAPADGQGPTAASNAPAQGAKPESPTPKVTAVADPTKDKGWPREFKKEHAVLPLHQPQIDEWPEQLKLKGAPRFPTRLPTRRALHEPHNRFQEQLCITAANRWRRSPSLIECNSA